jgi:ABC-type uncharacterized transport system fused permease/ATPase subunit
VGAVVRHAWAAAAHERRCVNWSSRLNDTSSAGSACKVEMTTNPDQSLLAGLLPQATSSVQERSHRSNAILSQMDVFRFVFLTPMSCNIPVAFVLVLTGVGASAAVGALMALLAKQLGNINLSFQRQDAALFDASIQSVILFISLTVVAQGIATFCMKHIGLMKRIHLNRTMHSDYLTNKSFYALNAFHSDHCDCIDSRLTSDIETMTSELYGIIQTVVTQLTAFIYSMTFLSNDQPALIALLCLCLFSVILLSIIHIFFKRTSSFVSHLKKDEGLFIFQHTRIKKNCESIAFYSGQFLELEKIKLIFNGVLKSYRMVIKSQMIMDFLGNIYNNGIGSIFVIWIGESPTCTIISLHRYTTCHSWSFCERICIVCRLFLRVCVYAISVFLFCDLFI